MSAGAFTTSKYATNQDVVTPIRIQPETLAAAVGAVANDPPPGVVADKIFTKVSGSLSLSRIRARRITIRFPATGQPAGYKPLGITTIPALTKTFYNACATAGVGGAITYLGVATCTIAGGDPRETRAFEPIPDA